MINKVTLIGNLGKDPELRHLESGAVVAKFSIATNENYKDKSGEWQTNTEWHDVVAWRYQAEYAERHLKKGSLAFIEGKLTHRKWQDKDGNDRYTTEVLANNIKTLERRESSGNNAASNFPTASDEPAISAASTPTKSTNGTDFQKEEDDLPF